MTLGKVAWLLDNFDRFFQLSTALTDFTSGRQYSFLFFLAVTFYTAYMATSRANLTENQSQEGRPPWEWKNIGDSIFHPVND